MDEGLYGACAVVSSGSVENVPVRQYFEALDECCGNGACRRWKAAGMFNGHGCRISDERVDMVVAVACCS